MGSTRQAVVLWRVPGDAAEGRFQAIDLRWGVNEEAGRDHRAMEICLAEIKRCQEVTPKPNFVVLLGERYG